MTGPNLFYWFSKLMLVISMVGYISMAAEQNPIIEQVEKDVQVLTEAGMKPAKTGMALKYGQKIVTGEKSHAVIVYPNGSKIWIYPVTLFFLKPPAHATTMGGEPRQETELERGRIRGEIKKENPNAKSIKYLVRTRSAVMGVRGTEFVVDQFRGKAEAEFHTLEGTVEVGKTETDINEGRGVSVKENEMVHSSASGISKPMPFERKSYLENLDSAFIEPSSDYFWFQVNLGAVALKQKSGGFGASPSLGFSARMKPLPILEVSAGLVGFLLPDLGGGARLKVVEPLIELGFCPRDRFCVLAGAGRQFWLNTVESAFDLLVDGTFRSTSRGLFCGTSIQGGYVLNTTDPAYFLRASIEIRMPEL